jgi:hypothetical protein
MVDRATLWNFIGVLRQHWFAAMSGGFSVPFTAAAVYFDSKYAQSIFGFLALASLYFAAYQIWKSEHDKVLVIQERLNPTRIRESKPKKVTRQSCVVTPTNLKHSAQPSGWMIFGSDSLPRPGR